MATGGTILVINGKGFENNGQAASNQWVNSYQRAFVDLFEDELLKKQYDWKKVLFETLLEGDEPLINGLIGGCE